MEEFQYFPVYVFPKSPQVSLLVLNKFNKGIKKMIKKLIQNSIVFSDQMMIGRGTIFTRTGEVLYFHNVFDLKLDNIESSIFLICDPSQHKQFGQKASFIIH